MVAECISRAKNDTCVAFAHTSREEKWGMSAYHRIRPISTRLARSLEPTTFRKGTCQVV